jgi:hypothetical protein
MSLNSNSSATAVYGSVTSGAVNWTDAKGNEVVSQAGLHQRTQRHAC